ncbi:hypothetical protein FS320_39095 [Microvirga tunisiensis]|uniref:Uncharacterized protein n=3 Tax=Microvirga tunisiensis TaxID=2108360 RepID=A0A5N7MV41_9HYPH|nr:hypothetical protein [Microvirga tunisiensis]
MTDEHLPGAAALLWVETQIEVDTDEDGCVLVDIFNDDPILSAVRLLSPFSARLMADALLEAAKLAEGRNPMNEPCQGRA